MKTLLLSLAISLLTLSLQSQTDCNIKDEYHAIFKVEKQNYRDKEYLFQSVNLLESESCFAELVAENKLYINYLRQHFTSNLNYDELLSITSEEELQKTYVRALLNDPEFSELMSDLENRVNKPNSAFKDTVSIDQMLNIAVKYFSIKGINEQGSYEGKVCAGINGIKQTEAIRKPHLEAFCFNSILTHMQGEEFNLYNEFVKGIKELYKLNLGVENEERLLRAQGAMYMFMRNNEILKQALITEYQKKKEFIPFLLEIK